MAASVIEIDEVDAAKGFVAGFFGTLGMAGMSFTLRRLVNPDKPIAETHYESVVKHTLRKVRRNSDDLDRETQIRVGEAAHFLFGGFWGVVYAIVRKDARIRPFLEGTTFGTAVWILGFGLYMPRLKFSKGVWEMDVYEAGRTLACHVAFGTATTLILKSLRE